MAACSVTTGGTNGTLRIDYDLAGDHNVLFSTYGDVIWIDDTATNVTYTTLTGDVTASSGCLTITALPKICYLVEQYRWSGDATEITYNATFDVIDNVSDADVLPPVNTCVTTVLVLNAPTRIVLPVVVAVVVLAVMISVPTRVINQLVRFNHVSKLSDAALIVEFDWDIISCYPVIV